MARRSLVLVLAGFVAVGCGSSGANSSFKGGLSDGGAVDGSLGDGAGLDDGSCSNCFNNGDSTSPAGSLTISPATATLVVKNGAIVTQAFHAVATYAGGGTQDVGASWSVTDAPIGTVDSNGLYTPRGTQGGVATVTAVFGGLQATATVTIDIQAVDDQVSGGTPSSTASALRGAAAAADGDAGTPTDGGLWDTTIQWTYPYDQTVYPRGISAPLLMWNNGAAVDVYYVRVSGPTYLLESFANVPPPSQYAFNAALWTAFTNSTAGPAELTVARYSKGVATVVKTQTWTISSGSMSGTIYYWAINEGAVVRIKPGATKPDTFLSATKLPLSDGGTAAIQCPSCHSISANGSMLAMSTGPWGSSTADVSSTLYNLQSSSTLFNSYERVNDPPSQFSLAGLTPDGAVLVENWAPVRGNGAGQTDTPVDLSSPAPKDVTLPALPGTNLETLVGSGHHTFFPAFSPDNQLFVYVDSSSNNLIALSWNAATKTFSSPVTLATASSVAGTKIAYPTISPDHRWVIYQRGPDFGSLSTTYTGDLYAVDTTKPGAEIPLDTLNGLGYPFAAGATRDADRSYEPTFAPVAAGGYFWIVFHSRRTYGNLLTGPAFTAEGSGTKQLWVAAIDLSPSGKDPSHEPFWLPGQDLTTLNMRGYWSLPPCEGDGQTCSTGSDCCGGYCDETNDAGAPVCGKSTTQTCSSVGDKCTTSSDCCNAQTSGVTCINGSCAEPPPQ